MGYSMKGIATLKIVGDIMLGGSVKKKIIERGASFPFERLPVEMKRADIFFGNLECSLYGGNNPPRKKRSSSGQIHQ